MLHRPSIRAVADRSICLLKRHRLEKVRKALGDRVKKRMAELMAKTRQLAQLLLSKSCGALAYSDPLDA
jgi:hypothetical protein